MFENYSRGIKFLNEQLNPKTYTNIKVHETEFGKL